ncbi:hypothetical protein Tco_0683563 [Tanacetum coccineum]
MACIYGGFFSSAFKNITIIYGLPYLKLVILKNTQCTIEENYSGHNRKIPKTHLVVGVDFALSSSKEGIDLWNESFAPVYGLETSDTIATLMETKNKLDLNNNGTPAQPTKKHLKELKRISRYLWGTVNMGLWYTKDSGFELIGFSYADHAGCQDSFKSTSGGTQFLGEKLVSYSSKKQDCTALSIAEAEYVSLSTCCAQVL